MRSPGNYTNTWDAGQIGAQFEGKRPIHFLARDHEKRHGRTTTWELSAKEAPVHIKANWPGSAWIVEMTTTTATRKGKRAPVRHFFLTSIRTYPDALLRLIRQRWSNCFAEAWRLRKRVALGS